MVRFSVGAHKPVFDFAAVPCFEYRKIMEELEATVGHAFSSLEPAEMALTRKRPKDAFAGRGAEQVYILQMVAESEIG